MAVNDLYTVAVQQSYQNARPVNVFYYRETAAGTANNSTLELLNAFNAAVMQAWADAVSEDVKFDCLIGRKIDPPDAVPSILSNVIPTGGTRIGDAAAGQAQAVTVKYPLANVTPWIRGLWNLVGTLDIDWEKGQMTITFNNLLNALNNFLIQPLVGATGWDFTPVIYSPTRKKLGQTPYFVDWKDCRESFGKKVLKRRRGIFHDYA